MEILTLKEDDSESFKLDPAPRIAHVLNLGVDWDRKVIHLSGELDEHDGERIWTLLEYFADDAVQLHLSTPGGDVSAMYVIHDAIRLHGNVTVLGYGEICSAGVLILACGHNRLVAPSTCLMSHEQTAGGSEVGMRASKDRRKWEDWQHEYWCELMARYTPKDAAWWRKTTERKAEFWLLGGAAIVEAGIADGVTQ